MAGKLGGDDLFGRDATAEGALERFALGGGETLQVTEEWLRDARLLSRS
jgi:hypothetical protein